MERLSDCMNVQNTPLKNESASISTAAAIANDATRQVMRRGDTHLDPPSREEITLLVPLRGLIGGVRTGFHYNAGR